MTDPDKFSGESSSSRRHSGAIDSSTRLRVSVEGGDTHEVEGPITAGSTLARHLGRAGIPLNMRCGGRGLCHGCEVEITAGTIPAISRSHGETGTIRACQVDTLGPGTVALNVPVRSALAARPQVQEGFRLGIPHALDPLHPQTTAAPYALAVDIGTTTVVASLVDRTGAISASASALNAQTRVGDDVVARMQRCFDDPDEVTHLQQLIVRETLDPLIGKVLATVGRGPESVAGITLAGNSTMLHLLAGIDPSPMANVPFAPAFLESRRFRAGDLGLAAVGVDCPLVTLPGISAYVGADITAGILTSGMHYHPRRRLLIDIGTNGEMVLNVDGTLWACATAAGPAFEGCGLTNGVRGISGAIARIRPSDDGERLTGEPIGTGRPRDAVGICGSGYIDLLAAARVTGLLDENGRWLASHPQVKDGSFQLVPGNPRTRVTGADIALLRQAKAAIGGGIATLLESAGVAPDELEGVDVSGGFGFHLDRANAVAIGLLPAVPVDRITVWGNSSLAGAFLATVDRSLLDEMELIRNRVRVIELNDQPSFEDHYIDALALP